MAEQHPKVSSVAPLSTARFWNFKMAGGWAALACGCLALFLLLGSGSLLSLFGVLLAVYALQASLISLVGIVVRQNHIAIPRSVYSPIPVLVFGRMTIAFPTEITVFQKFMSLERISVTTPNRKMPVLFSSRTQRRAFFSVIKERIPNIKIYQAY
jgi:hypothetical protein